MRPTNLFAKNEYIADNQVFTKLITGHWPLITFSRSHLFEVQNVSWKPANTTLRLTAYVVLLRSHLFEVPDGLSQVVNSRSLLPVFLANGYR